MEKALQKVVQLLGPDAAQLIWRARFERVQHMSGANQKIRRIADTSDKEQLGDYLAEVLFALIFAGLGFRVEIEPLGEKGPDLRILRDDHSAIVETMRFRKIYPGPPMLSLDETSILPVYGNLPRDIRKAFEKILAKFPQLSDEESIIAIWNDDEDLEEIEVETESWRKPPSPAGTKTHVGRLCIFTLVVNGITTTVSVARIRRSSSKMRTGRRPACSELFTG